MRKRRASAKDVPPQEIELASELAGIGYVFAPCRNRDEAVDRAIDWWATHWNCVVWRRLRMLDLQHVCGA